MEFERFFNSTPVKMRYSQPGTGRCKYAAWIACNIYGESFYWNRGYGHPYPL